MVVVAVPRTTVICFCNFHDSPCENTKLIHFCYKMAQIMVWKCFITRRKMGNFPADHSSPVLSMVSLKASHSPCIWFGSGLKNHVEAVQTSSPLTLTAISYAYFLLTNGIMSSWDGECSPNDSRDRDHNMSDLLSPADAEGLHSWLFSPVCKLDSFTSCFNSHPMTFQIEGDRYGVFFPMCMAYICPSVCR